MPNKLTKYVSNNLWLQVQLALRLPQRANAIRSKQGEVFFLMRYILRSTATAVHRSRLEWLSTCTKLDDCLVWWEWRKYARGNRAQCKMNDLLPRLSTGWQCGDVYSSQASLGSTAHNTMILPPGFTMSSEMFNWNREPTSYMHAYIGENACIAYKPTDIRYGFWIRH